MSLAAARGFTLVELLVVIAIIAILAGMVAVTLPRALERAKITDVSGDLNNIRTAMVEYYTKHDSYPPAYGYYVPPAKVDAYRTPWTQRVGLVGVEDLNDRFSYTMDTDGDGAISLLEFDRPYAKNPDGTIGFGGSNDLYDGSQPIDAVDGERTYVYLPVNLNQATKVRKYFADPNGDGNYDDGLELGALDPDGPRIWPQSLTDQISIPPPRLDAFVLMSVGPGANTGTGGLLLDINIENNPPLEERYYITALHAYFLATRDWDGNGELDFDFEARGSGSENALFPGKFPGAQGPIIYTHP